MNTSVKIFFISLIGFSFWIWEIGFNLGAYKTIFFPHVFAVWFVSIAFLLGYLVVPDVFGRFSKRTLISLFAPTLWFAGEIIQYFTPESMTVGVVVWLLRIGTLFICLPYFGYLLLSITQSETLSLKPKKLLYALFGILLSILAVSYLVGEYHQLFLSCYDFEISGSSVPADCWKGN